MADSLNALLIFGGDASGAIKAVQALNKNISGLTQKVNNMNRQMAQSGKTGMASFGGLQAIFKNLFGVVQRTVDGLRLMTQGLMSMGRATLFFISLPLGMALRSAFTAAVDFEAQLVRVRKTANLSKEEFIQMGEALRTLASRAPSTHAELGLMAEQAGQLGITGVKAITEFVEWMEILSQSTNISGEEVVQTMGKIANAFGWSISDSRQEVIRLANVMNQLENDTASTAAEIAEALFRFAPVANQLGIAAHDAAALSAALVSVGVSAESAGTRLGTMFVKMTQNSDKFAELAAGTEKYATQADVLNAINEDAVSVLFDLIVMMGETDNRAEALAAGFDLVGLRGGRALGALAAGQENFTDAMRVAREEWVAAESLITEYNRQLESTEAQMGILRNNITNVALAIGDALLPVVNEVVQFAIPGVRKLIAVLDDLGDRTKIIVVAALLAVVAFGPLVFLLSQVVFGITMFTLGILKLIAAVGSAIYFVGTFIVSLLTLSSTAWLVAAGVAAAAIVIMKVLQDTGRDIASFFTGLADRATAWGERLAAEYAGGFIAGAVRYIAAAITWVANLIASYLEGHSPPDVGPLSHIDKWGKTVFDAYLRGMAKADFGILRSVGRTIDNILKNFAKSKLTTDKDAVITLLKARENLAKLLKIFRETGTISNKVLDDIVSGLGNAADEVRDLIKLQLELLAIEEALKDLEEQRQNTLERYGQQIEDIAGGGGSAAERVADIRAAMRARNDELKRIAKQKKEMEKQKSVAEEQLATQKAMIEAMQEQDNIQARLIKAMEKLADAAESGGFEFPEIEPGQLAVKAPNIQELLEEIGAPIIELEVKLKSKSGMWDAFVKGLKGESLVPEGRELQEDPIELFGIQEGDVDTFWTLYNLGVKIKTVWDGAVETFNNVKNTLGGVGISKDMIPEGVQTKLDQFSAWWETNWPFIQAVLLTGWTVIKAAWDEAVALIGPKIEELMAAFGGLGSSVEGLGINWGAVWGFLGTLVLTTISTIIGVIASLVGAILDGVTWLIRAWGVLLDKNASFGEKMWAIWDTTIGLILHVVSAFILNLIKYFQGLYNRLVGRSIIPDMLAGIKEVFVSYLGEILTGVIEWVSGIIETIISLKEQAIENITQTWENIKQTWEDKSTEITTKFNTWKDETIQKFKDLGAAMIQGFADKIREKISSVLSALQSLKDRALRKLQPLIDLWKKVKNIAGGSDDNGDGGDTAAEGGTTFGGKGFFVGEEGWEWFQPGTFGQIVNQATLGKLFGMGSQSGQGGIGQLILNFGTDSVRSEEDIHMIAEAVKEVIDNQTSLDVLYGAT